MKKLPLTLKDKALLLIESIVDDEFCNQSDVDFYISKIGFTEREKMYYKKLEQIYRFAHIANKHKCKHPDWEKELGQSYKNYEKH